MISIMRYAKGLTSLLDAKTGGRLPGDFAETIAGIVDVRELYLLNDRQFMSVPAITLPTVGANFFVNGPSATEVAIVPPAELWYVWEYFVGITPAAGETGTIQPAWVLDTTGQTMPVGDSATATTGQAIRAYARKSFWAGPGSQMAFIPNALPCRPALHPPALITVLGGYPPPPPRRTVLALVERRAHSRARLSA